MGKLPDQVLELFRATNIQLMDISDLSEETKDVYWHYPSYTTTDKAVASTFSGGGKLISFIDITNAKSIRAFSLAPSETEFILMYTSVFEVKVAWPSVRPVRRLGFGGSSDPCLWTSIWLCCGQSRVCLQSVQIMEVQIPVSF